MKAPLPTVTLHDVHCNGCGGTGGKHVDFRCPFLIAQAERIMRYAGGPLSLRPARRTRVRKGA